MRYSTVWLCAAFGVLAFGATAQDADKGEEVFKKCATCHQIGEGAKNRVGPILTGVFGRAAGSLDGFRYGKSIKTVGETGLVWNAKNLDAYLSDPAKFLRAELADPNAKAKMKFRLKKAEERTDVIAYLATFSAGVEEEETPEMSADEMLETAADAICVRNRNSHEHLFAVEAIGAERRVRMLKPGEVLCTQTDSTVKTGTVSVYEHSDELEGCSRLVPVGRTEDMLKYVDFDRCFWSSNS